MQTNAIPIKVSMTFFIEIEKNTPKICTKTQKTPKAKVILSKKNKAGVIKIPDFKTHYKVVLTKIA
jgi:hypothetical protein